MPEGMMRQWLAGAVVGGLLGGVTAALVVLALVPQVTRAAPDDQVQPVVRTQRLDLVDSRGQSRATLDLDDEGATRFILADQDGVIRLRARVNRGGASALLGGGDMGDRISLDVGPNPELMGGRSARLE